jgi:hypothetical protein
MALERRWTAAVSMGLVVGALLACKKKPDAATEASATPSASAAPAASAATSAVASASAAAPAATVEAKLGDVKRYGVDKEVKLDDSGVRVTAADGLKVYDEADIKTDDVATLPKDLLVFRQVKMEDFTLVEFPSGVGQFSQGWVQTSGLSTTVEKVTRAAALSENKTAAVKPTVKDGGAPEPADAGAKPKASSTKPEPPPVPEPKKATTKKTTEKKTK